MPIRFLAAAVTACTPFLTVPASAAPLSGSLALNNAGPAAPVETVQWRRGGWGGGRWGGGRWGGGRWIGPAAGLGAGVIIGGALASRPYYDYGYSYSYGPGYDSDYDDGYVAVAPGPVDGDSVAYCQQRFRSYDPASGTYLGYDGMRHSCP